VKLNKKARLLAEEIWHFVLPFPARWSATIAHQRCEWFGQSSGRHHIGGTHCHKTKAKSIWDLSCCHIEEIQESTIDMLREVIRLL
jgi:hypothetical protein